MEAIKSGPSADPCRPCACYLWVHMSFYEFWSCWYRYRRHCFGGPLSRLALTTLPPPLLWSSLSLEVKIWKRHPTYDWVFQNVSLSVQCRSAALYLFLDAAREFFYGWLIRELIIIVFQGLGYFTQDDFFLVPFTCKFQNHNFCISSHCLQWYIWILDILF